MRFTEIEHKFIVGPDFDLPGLCRTLRGLQPFKETALLTEDTYFLCAAVPHLIYRHRCDDERQELTVKNRTEADPEVRLEVNLRLSQEAGSQREAVAAFLAPLQITWQGRLQKQIHVFYFPDCEVVHYHAMTASRGVRCVEFEARGQPSVDAARQVLARYEDLTGFTGKERSFSSLFDLLLLPEIPARQR
jgi:hypothetical protein